MTYLNRISMNGYCVICQLSKCHGQWMSIDAYLRIVWYKYAKYQKLIVGFNLFTVTFPKGSTIWRKRHEMTDINRISLEGY